MKQFFFACSLVLLSFSCTAQSAVTSTKTESSKSIINPNRPKLVVGIVVDQMRYDYLTRFENKYGKGGFMRLISEGFNCKNNHFNYIPTYTGPGHASVYTGTTPKHHGIIANNWYNKFEKQSVYCAGDDSVESVGTTHSAGKMSPHRMMTTSFADENRLFTQMRGKTIGISVKDRGSILPAGHTANAAYWFHGKDEGNWITSSFYMNELPDWVKQFNTQKSVSKYMTTWNTLYDINTYVECGSDLNDFEGTFKGKDTATFPYDLAALKDENAGYDILKSTAFGNSIVTDFAIAALHAEKLGQDNDTDVLAVSYSSTDYVGHRFGVNSKEIQDTYLRLDKELERLLKELDNTVGKGNYTVFLTADHGAVNVPAYLQSVNIPAGYLDNKKMKADFENFLTKTYGTAELVENVSNNQIFLDREKIKALKLDLAEVQQAIVNEIINYDNVYKAYTSRTMSATFFGQGIELLLQNGFNQKRSGDVLMMHDPAFISYSRTGSTHGSGLNYDTHVPLLFYGAGINQGSTMKRTNIVDIAPTMSALLGISFPNGATGQPLSEVID